jgi:hypothetical protein
MNSSQRINENVTHTKLINELFALAQQEIESLKFERPNDFWEKLADFALHVGRHLFALATGEQVTSRKRCDDCGGDGSIRASACVAVVGPADYWRCCPACGGSGYAG